VVLPHSGAAHAQAPLDAQPGQNFGYRVPVEPSAEPWVPPLHALGLMTVMRIGEAVIWPEPFADFRPKVMARGYRNAFTRPPKWDSSRSAFEWDGDNWYLNSAGHGLFGSELYLRARMCRWGPASALLFTATASAVWEYGFEATHVRPSALDLVYTPAAGIIFGEFRYQLWHISRTIQDPDWRRVVGFALDPFGSFERLAGAAC